MDLSGPATTTWACCSLPLDVFVTFALLIPMHIISGLSLPDARSHTITLPRPQTPSSTMSKTCLVVSECTPLPVLQTSQPFCCVRRFQQQSVISDLNSVLTWPFGCTGYACPMFSQRGAQFISVHGDLSRTMNSDFILWWSHNWVGTSHWFLEYKTTGKFILLTHMYGQPLKIYITGGTKCNLVSGYL